MSTNRVLIGGEPETLYTRATDTGAEVVIPGMGAIYADEVPALAETMLRLAGKRFAVVELPEADEHGGWADGTVHKPIGGAADPSSSLVAMIPFEMWPGEVVYLSLDFAHQIAAGLLAARAEADQ